MLRATWYYRLVGVNRGTLRQKADSLRDSLNVFTRVRLAALPTPIEACPNLSEAIGDVEIRVKRDDLTGLGLGGNKARHLEYVIGDALQQGTTAIVSGSNMHTNLPRQLAAACAKVGIRPYMLLRGRRPEHLTGNLLIYALMDGRCRFVDPDRYYADFRQLANEWAAELTAAGERTYLFDDIDPEARGIALAAMGYVNAFLEVEQQFDEADWRPEVIYINSAVTSQGGLAAAIRATGAAFGLVGVTARSPGGVEMITKVANNVSNLLELDQHFEEGEITNLATYVGPVFGKPTPESMEAASLAARTEGLVLDPIYTGRALAALIDGVRSGSVQPGARVLFWHTGGVPALYEPEAISMIEADWLPGAGS